MKKSAILAMGLAMAGLANTTNERFIETKPKFTDKEKRKFIIKTKG